MGANGLVEAGDRGDIQGVGFLGLSAGDRDFRSDDIDQGFRVRRIGFGHGAKIGGPPSNLGKSRICLIAASHTGIKMDFRETSFDIEFDQCARFRHRPFNRFRFPRVWAKVVAAKDQLVHWNARFVCHTAKPRHEVLGRHASISAILIDLITGRFDHRRRPEAWGCSFHLPLF